MRFYNVDGDIVCLMNDNEGNIKCYSLSKLLTIPSGEFYDFYITTFYGTSYIPDDIDSVHQLLYENQDSGTSITGNSIEDIINNGLNYEQEDILRQLYDCMMTMIDGEIR